VTSEDGGIVRTHHFSEKKSKELTAACLPLAVPLDFSPTALSSALCSSLGLLAESLQV
jgi:small neutral amino acid transporter SnatA (MarC family)